MFFYQCETFSFFAINTAHLLRVMIALRFSLAYAHAEGSWCVLSFCFYVLDSYAVGYIALFMPKLYLYIGSRALSFSDPYIRFACLSVRHSVIRSVIRSVCEQLRS